MRNTEIQTMDTAHARITADNGRYFVMYQPSYRHSWRYIHHTPFVHGGGFPTLRAAKSAARRRAELDGVELEFVA